MAISSETNRNNYVGNGATLTYAYGFRILDDDHLLVTVRDSVGTETTLTKTTDYTVTGVGQSSGNVVLVAGSQAWIDGSSFFETGWVLSIRRMLPLTQPTDIRNQGNFYPETHEDSFDRLVMQNQQQQDEIDRGVRLPETVDPATFDATVPAAIVGEAGAVLKVNDDGDGWTVGSASLTGATVTPYMETVLDDLNASAARSTLGIDGASGNIATGDLAANAVTTAKIADSNVTTAKIADSNVTTAKIADAAVTAAKLAEATYLKTGATGGTSASSATAYTSTPSPAFTAYAAGMTITTIGVLANTGAATLNVNGLGAKDIKVYANGSLANPPAGSIPAGAPFVCIYDGTQFILLAAPGNPVISSVMARGGNGRGSTDTSVCRFDATQISSGAAITYADSSTAGGTFTINEAGIYALSMSDNATSGNYHITKNYTGTTETDAGVLARAASVVGANTNGCSWTGPLSAADVIRVTANVNPSTNDAFHFTVTKIR